MNSPAALIGENLFNIAYLTTVWALVVLMARKMKAVKEAEKPLASRFLLAFSLLAFGDSFHVGARVIEALVGPAKSVLMIGGVEASILGLGMLATAYTMTVFYMALADARRIRAGGKPDAAFWIIEAVLALRLVIMALPGNAWELAVPPFGMGLVRNAPLALAGILMAILFIVEGRRDGDPAWQGIGWAMVASYAFYTPVILFAARIPAIGLLMIPKTVAYVVMGFIAYGRWWKPRTGA